MFVNHAYDHFMLCLSINLRMVNIVGHMFHWSPMFFFQFTQVNLLLTKKQCASPCLATSLYWFAWAHLGYCIVYGIYLRKPCDHIVSNSNSTPEFAHWMNRELFHSVSNCKSCKLLFHVHLSITLIMADIVGNWVLCYDHIFLFSFCFQKWVQCFPKLLLCSVHVHYIFLHCLRMMLMWPRRMKFQFHTQY